jgi:NRAMP (natural resistance-associated macrophage protein)-like metal ion transporter
MQKLFSKIKMAWKHLGPGLITGASDDDPSGITTYTQAGSSFGLGTLWTAAITFPLMTAIQEMCGRIGIVTRSGLTGVVRKNYPKAIVYIITALIVPACILNIAADLAGIGAVGNLIFPNIPSIFFTFLSGFAVVLGLILLPYKKIESVLKYFAMVLVVYLVVPFFQPQNWGEILQASVIPHIEFSKGFIAILVALLGTTISPYLFVWEDSLEVEELAEEQRENILPEQNDSNVHTEIKAMQKDNLVGMFFSNFVMFFIILSAGTIIFKSGVHDIQSVADAAQALKPVAGEYAYLLFAIGVIGTGFLAIPVLAGACSYTLKDTLGLTGGMNSKLSEAKGFYGVISVSVLIGALINLLGINPIQILIWTAIAYGIISPPLIALILHICNNKKIMGAHTNGRVSNILGGTCLLLMTVACGALLWTSLF